MTHDWWRDMDHIGFHCSAESKQFTTFEWVLLVVCAVAINGCAVASKCSFCPIYLTIESSSPHFLVVLLSKEVGWTVACIFWTLGEAPVFVGVGMFCLVVLGWLGSYWLWKSTGVPFCIKIHPAIQFGVLVSFAYEECCSALVLFGIDGSHVS